ncbi:plasmalemma vesicle associated protein a [Odontesthes bonariensis]|uniref:plasmalemma vesicle associated protein a n=1 Tax=Odontesthes bonariensis TaxID=219752 RepID=UPI003F5826B9
MYSSGYSQVNKFSPQGQRKMQHRSKGKSCGYYMRIVFFFSSLIQSLIIVSLVLFLVYGKSQDSTSTTRIQDLEESFSRLSIENVALRQQRQNLTNLLNATLTDKARNDWDLARLRDLCNKSFFFINDFDKKLQQCNAELFMLKRSNGRTVPLFTPVHNSGAEELKARYHLLESNFTQTMQSRMMEMHLLVRERDNLSLETIRLRRDKSTQEKELEIYRQNTKDEFRNSLKSVSNISRAFLEKIDSLFPRHIAFQLTCPKQREHLEQIRSNCTSLSREVEDKLQSYMNNVGEQVSSIQAENNHLKAENWRLSADYRSCSQNLTGIIEQNRKNREELQRKHDENKERLLLDKMRLLGEIDVLNKNVKYKEREVDHLTERFVQLNMSCISKTGTFPGSLGLKPNIQTQPGWGSFGGAGSSSSSSSSSTLGQLGRTGSDSSFSSGSTFNKPGSTGAGSSSLLFPSSGSSSSLSNTGLGVNKPGSTGAGASRSLFPSSGSSSSLSNTGLGVNKPGSTGAGASRSLFPSTGSSSSLSNTGLGVNKPGSTGAGASRSLFPSTGSSSSLSNTGLGFSKPGSTGAGSSSSLFPSPGSSSSKSNTGLGFSKPGSTGAGSSSSLFPSSGSSSSLTNTGLGFNKPGSTGAGSSSSLFPSSGSSSSLTNTGLGFNKPGSTGAGSSSSLFPSSGSSSSLTNTGLGFNKPGSTGAGSSSSLFPSSGSSSSLTNTGLGFNKPGSSAGAFSNFGMTGSSSSLSPGGTGSNKPAVSERGSTAIGSSSGSTGSSTSASKSGSTNSGFSWFGLGSSNSGQSKTGSVPGKTSSGNSYVGTGSSFGGGRTNALGGGSDNINQHLRDLQRLINPSGPQEKQDLSRMLG